MPSSNRSAYMKEFRARQRQGGSRRVNVTLTAEEFDRIEARGQLHGERVTTHLKTCAFAYLDNEYVLPPDILERLDALLFIMRGVGNNLNQLARHSNEMRYFLDTEEVRLKLKLMDEAVRAFVSNPPRPARPEE